MTESNGVCELGLGKLAEFDGDWVPARITNGILSFHEDADEHIRIEARSSTEFSMTYDRKTFTAKLCDDGKLYWSDGDVWARKFEVDFDDGRCISTLCPPSVSMRVVRLLMDEFGYPLPARIQSLVEGILSNNSCASPRQKLWFVLCSLGIFDPLGCECSLNAIQYSIRSMPDVDKHWAMNIAPASESLDDILVTQVGWHSVKVMSIAGDSLNNFLTVHEVARIRRISPCADEGCHLQRRLERERPAYHTGVIKFVDFAKKFGVVQSDAGQTHIFLENDMSFELVDGQELVSLENDLHGGLCWYEDAEIKGERVIFDLQPNTYKGVKKPLKAVNVQVKLTC
jgi:hypothetical protein